MGDSLRAFGRRLNKAGCVSNQEANNSCGLPSPSACKKSRARRVLQSHRDRRAPYLARGTASHNIGLGLTSGSAQTHGLALMTETPVVPGTSNFIGPTSGRSKGAPRDFGTTWSWRRSTLRAKLLLRLSILWTQRRIGRCPPQPLPDRTNDNCDPLTVDYRCHASGSPNAGELLFTGCPSLFESLYRSGHARNGFAKARCSSARDE